MRPLRPEQLQRGLLVQHRPLRAVRRGAAAGRRDEGAPTCPPDLARGPEGGRNVVRGLLIAGLATAASSAMASAALAEPTLRVREHCPVEGGQQVYGAEATASGLPPNTVFDFEVSFGGRSGDSYAVSSDANGDLAPLRA